MAHEPAGAAPDGAVDVVLVGSGIGALTTAALVSLKGARVAVFEQGPDAGGYAHGFRRGDWHFDPGIHVMADPALFEGVLAYLGADEGVETIPVDRFFRLHVEDLVMDVPIGRERFVATLAAAFPHEERGIRGFMELCQTIHLQAHDLPPRLPLAELDEAARRFPELFRWQRSTIAEAMDEFLSDPRLRAVISSTWAYLGVPPSRASFLTFAQLTCVHLDGVFAFRGGMQSCVDALSDAIRRRGGELHLESPVAKILIEDSRAIGVRLGDGTEVPARLVISGADPFQTYERLVGEQHVPARFMQKIRRLRPSGSAFVLFAATSSDVARHDPPHQIFSYSGLDYDEVQRRSGLGELGVRCVTPASVLDPTLAPPGEHVISLNANAPWDPPRPWPELRDEVQQAMLDVVEDVLPGFREGLLYAESATPLAMADYTRNVRGAIHSFEQTPDQTETRRPPQISPVPGLYMSSQWTSTGGSAIRSFVAGIAAAKLVLDELGIADDIPDFRSVPKLLEV